MLTHPKVGLALGSGSARGLAHLGVLHVLDAEGIPVACIAGTSIGAIVGAVYAAGKFREALAFVEQFDWKKVPTLMDPLFPVSGLLGGKPIEKLFTTLLQEEHLEHFPIPFAAIATNVATGAEVVLTYGDAVKAVRASMSLPGIFTPVCWQEQYLVDGGLVNPVPVNIVRQLGAEVVIAVNLAADMSTRSLIGTGKAEEESAQSLATDRKRQRNQLTQLFKSKYFGPDMPELMKDVLEKSKGFVEEQTQALEHWFDEHVGQGKLLLEEKRAALAEWLVKDQDTPDLPDIFSVLMNSLNIMQIEIARNNLRQDPPDVLLAPQLGKVRLLDFAQAAACIAEGERVTRAALPQIQQALARVR